MVPHWKRSHRIATEDEVRIILGMSDSVGGGVISAKHCTDRLVAATVDMLNNLQDIPSSDST